MPEASLESGQPPSRSLHASALARLKFARRTTASSATRHGSLVRRLHCGNVSHIPSPSENSMSRRRPPVTHPARAPAIVRPVYRAASRRRPYTQNQSTAIRRGFAWFRLRLSQDGARCEMLLLAAYVHVVFHRRLDVDGASPLQDRITHKHTLWQVPDIDATLQGQMRERKDGETLARGDAAGRRYSLFLPNPDADASFRARPFALSL